MDAPLDFYACGFAVLAKRAVKPGQVEALFTAQTTWRIYQLRQQALKQTAEQTAELVRQLTFNPKA
jgi:hypothetical protein